jgi:hypothetical protein
VGKIVVEGSYSFATFLEPPPVCSGDTAMLTIGITGASGPWVVTFTDGTTTWTTDTITISPYTFQLIPTPTILGAYQYWITSVSNPLITNDTPGDPITLIVTPKPVTSPVFRY